MFVDGDKDGAQVGDVKQQVVDGIFDMPLETGADNGGEANAVQSAERVVGGEYVTSLGGDVLLVPQVERQVEILDELAHEVHSVLVFIAGQYLVDFILVDDADQIIHDEARDLARDLGGFLSQYLLYVYPCNAFCCHLCKLMGTKIKFIITLVF